ncbi:MAG: ankyrin repeat domain-containing protein [Pyrinomonadaceae bacterium]
MTRNDAVRFVERARGRVCIRYIVRPNGEMLTRKVPERLYRIGRRASRIATGAFSATLTLANAAAQTRPPNSLVLPTDTVECAATRTVNEPASDELPPGMSGTIKTSEGVAIADVTIVLVDRDTGVERYTTSSKDGEYSFLNAPPADYLLWARKRRFETERSMATVQTDAAGIREDFTLTEKNRHVMIMGGAMMAVADSPEDPLVQAVTNDDINVARTLAFATPDINEIRPRDGEPLLNHAVERGNREMAQVMMGAGANVNRRSTFGRTAIMALSEKTPVELVRDLIEAGAKMNARDYGGQSLLMIAARSGTPAVLREVVKAGARVDARDSSGETALFAAVRANNLEVIDILIGAGADVNAKDEDGQTALMATLFALDLKTFTALVEKGAAVDLSDDEGRTLLMLAVANEEPGIVELLLQMTSTLNATDSNGSTALMVAVESGPVKSAQLLIRAGALLETRDVEGRTALLRAASHGSVEMVEVLVAAGADFTVSDKEGKTALALAREAEQEDIVGFLKERGAPE